MKHRELNIPTKLAKHILADKTTKEFTVFLSLKSVYGSHSTSIDKPKIANLCGFKSLKTLYTHLKSLIKRNWVGFDGQTYFFRSTKYICELYGVTSGQTVHKIDCLTQLETINPLLLAIATKQIVSSRTYAARRFRRDQQACEDGLAVQQYTPTTISVRLLAELLGLSVNKTHRLKIQAIENGYLERKKNNRIVWEYELAYFYHKYLDRMYIKNGGWRINLTDDLYPLINTKRSKHFSSL